MADTDKTTDQTTDQTTDRAAEVNGRLVRAWMIREGLDAGPVPSLRDVSLAEAIAASETVTARQSEQLPTGESLLTCHVEPSRVPRLYAWTILHEVNPNG
jgi:hypothetical protein